MNFYDYFRSSGAFRVRIALNHKGIAAQRLFVHLRRNEQRAPEYVKLNPQGLVPTIIDDDGTIVTQSMAIIEYLEESRPDTPRLLPDDPAGRARVRAIAQAIACEIHPLNNLRVLQYLEGELGIVPATRDEKWYRHWIAVGLEGVEGLLRRDGAAGDFCHGDDPTLADVCLVPQIFNAQRFNADLSPYPMVMRAFENCMRHEAFSAARPSIQPDAEN